MTFLPRPHVSAALQHLRRSILLAALALGVALTAQMFVWAFVHFTDVRHTRLEPPSNPGAMVVKRADAAPPEQADDVDAGARTGPGRSLAGAAGARGAAHGAPPAATAVDPNVVPSDEGLILRSVSRLAQTAGIISALLLMVLMLQGVVIAGGAAVPGVEMAVTAATWSLIVGLLSLPLSHLLPAAPFTGVFVDYESVVAESAALREGATGAPGWITYYGMHAALPVLLLAGLAASVIRFRIGIERGVIATSISQIDERLEQEIRSRRLQLAQPRAIGALNSAIGNPAPVHAAPAPAVPEAPAVEPEPAPPKRGKPKPMMRRFAGETESDPLKRPI